MRGHYSHRGGFGVSFGLFGILLLFGLFYLYVAAVIVIGLVIGVCWVIRWCLTRGIDRILDWREDRK